MKKKAILSVSFGTKDKDLEKKTIDVLEKEYQDAFPNMVLYRAITNEALIQLMHQNEGEEPVYAVREILARMVLDGVTHVYVQPAYLLHGREYEELKDMIFSHKADFVEVKCGEPLLASQEDLENVAKAIMAPYGKLEDDEAACFVGHGSEHYTNAIYCALDYALKDQGFDNAHIATFNAYPKIDKVIGHLQKNGTKKVKIAPFMFVAGESAMEGVCGDAEDSMATQLRNGGFEVEANRKCLGEYPEIRQIFQNHLAAIIE